MAGQPERNRSPQDDIDTRALTPAQRERRNRTYSVLLAVALCAAFGLVGYTLGRRHRPRRSKTLVESEMAKPPTALPATSTAPAPAPAPPAQPQARIEDVEATLAKTQIRVRFATRVDKAAAEMTGSYTIEPDVMVIAAELADDGRTVTLTTSPLEHGTEYHLTVSRLEMAPAVPGDSQATFRYLDTRRVTGGLVALYGFEEAEGDTVHDSSRVGEPLDLKIREPEKTRWVPGGIEIRESTLIHSDGDADKLLRAFRAANAITIEAWLRPANTTQGGPSRIATFSRGPSVRNFTLGQEGANYIVRLRTTERDANGEPLVPTRGGVAQALTHAVYTRNADGKVNLYLNGQFNAMATVPGDFSNWAPFPFGLANEFDATRTWLGQLHLVALYARALTAEEVEQNWKAGPEGKTPRPDGAE